MILTAVVGSLALTALYVVVVIAQLTFWTLLGWVFIALGAALSFIALLSAWATGRRPVQ